MDDHFALSYFCCYADVVFSEIVNASLSCNKAYWEYCALLDTFWNIAPYRWATRLHKWFVLWYKYRAANRELYMANFCQIWKYKLHGVHVTYIQCYVQSLENKCRIKLMPAGILINILQTIFSKCNVQYFTISFNMSCTAQFNCYPIWKDEVRMLHTLSGTFKVYKYY